MADNLNKKSYNSNFAYMQQTQAATGIMGNMSVVPQQFIRPNTLAINGQQPSDSLLFTPNDYNKCQLSTPDLINALTGPTINDGQPSPGGKLLDDMFPTYVPNQAMLPGTHLYDPMRNRVLSTTDNNHLKQEAIVNYPMNQVDSQTLMRHRSISSSINDNESSNSTAPSSPLSIHQGGRRDRNRDELQHVPSNGANPNGDFKDLVRKEKKRERNRQAAQKCRTRKLTRIAELQKRVTELQDKNKNLTSIAECLQTDIVRLEKQLHDHHTQGCTLMNGSEL